MKVFEKQVGYGNPILTKSFEFAVDITKYYLDSVKKDFLLKDLLRQLLRSGTSIGANVSESQEAVSKKDFINKLSIALKEAKETEYWLKILNKTGVVSESDLIKLSDECSQIIRLLISILKKLKESNEL
ncbi:MAG: four helix bundle protein [Stygiobacter sp.]|jgi:four helix bundle protein